MSIAKIELSPLQQERELYKVVKKIKLTELLPDKKFPAGFDHAIIDQYGNILNFCSEKYEVVHNSEIFIPIEAEMKQQKIEFEKKINIISGSKFYVDYIIKKKLKTVSIGTILPKLSVSNSYDGTIKFQTSFGLYRLVCLNGMSRPTNKTSSTSSKHSLNIEKAGVFIDIINSIKKFINDSKKDIEIFEQMNKRIAGIPTIQKFGEKLKLSKKMIDVAEKRFMSETTKNEIQYTNASGRFISHKGSPKSLFTVYNAINFAINNLNDKELPEKKIEKDKQLLELVESSL